MLSESLYPTLQMLEITLRNTLHNAASEHFKNEWWFQNIEIIRFPNELQALAKAKATLQRQNKPITPGRLIAELNFGFWTSLMDKRYEHNQVLWPTLLKTAFPHMPKRIRKRQTLSKRFHKIRNLRNRIFHHEPIWYWQDLKQQHQQIIEAIGWIEPAAKEIITLIDRFPEIHQTGTENISKALVLLDQPESKPKQPIYLEQEVYQYFSEKAKAKGVGINTMINERLKKYIAEDTKQ